VREDVNWDREDRTTHQLQEQKDVGGWTTPVGVRL